MKRSFLVACSLLGGVIVACAQARAPLPPPTNPAPANPPPPVYPAPTTPAGEAPVYIYDQKPIGGRPYLVSPEQAQGIINRFKDEYKRLGNPRVLVYVNRELIDENSGLKLTSQRQVVETTRTLGGDKEASATNRVTERVVSTNIYRARDRKETPLADRQTVRDVERLFGRPLRMAGIQLADQRIASQLLGGRALEPFALQAVSEQARLDRQALTNVADVVLEILLSSKDASVSELGGDRTYSAPDLQATAIRLSDAKILGQATAADLIGQGPAAGRALRNFGIREIAEATALSLMEDMMLAPQQ